MKINTDILPKRWSILIWTVIFLSLQGCYTQLAMFHPSPEEEEEEFYSYSLAGPVKSVGMYAQDGAGTPLGMAYQLMYNRFGGFNGYGSGYYNKYDYYNRYGYHAGNSSYKIGGYTMYIPVAQYPDKGTPRTWTRDSKSSGTNLNVTRTRSSNTSESSNNGGYSNSSNVSSNGSSTGSSSKSSAGGRRATRRN